MVKGVEHLHFNDRLKHLGLMCLYTNRIKSDLIDTYKIINGIYGVKTYLFFDVDESGRRIILRDYLKEILAVYQKICI